ncbi:hypothetical protein [Tateyamaria sp.]|uniref:hypothetical protein n=1 Tax=Tateyamaria sp. TaxID=1929288 RepID=UPI00329C5139
MAKWAELMFYAATVALTLAALFAIVRTLHHTRRAADSSERMASDTQKIGPAQVRAYVSVEQATGALHEPTRVFGVTFRIRNNGQSPATNCKIGFDLTVYDAGRIVHSQTEGSKCPIQSISANSSVESLPIGNRDWDLDGLIADAGGALSLQIQGAFEGEDVFGGEIREDFTFYGFAEKEISISEIVFVRIQGAEKAS